MLLGWVGGGGIKAFHFKEGMQGEIRQIIVNVSALMSKNYIIQDGEGNVKLSRIGSRDKIRLMGYLKK